MHPGLLWGMDGLSQQATPTGAPGCVWLLSSIASIGTRALFTVHRDLSMREAGRRSAYPCGRARGIGRSVRAASSAAPDMTGSLSASSSWCRCGAWPCFLAVWAKLLTWQQVAETFGVSWGTVFAAVERGVEWGLARRQLDGIRAIGVDEVQWQRGHRYLTLVYQIEDVCKRLLYVGLERTADSLRGFFESVSTQVAAGLKYVCSDMWQPYLEVLAERAAQAVHVLDRYHLVARLNKAVDEVRAEEARRLKADGYEPVLKHSRWCLLKRPANLTDQQTVKLRELLKYNLRSVRAYLHKEDLQRLWEYHAPFWAGKFLGEWIRRVLRSRLEPMKKVARSMRNHMGLILNWFEARGTISAGSVEGKNYQVKLAMKNAYGFRTFRAIEIALFHKLGALPESELTHRFV